jgi:ABC-2 type transport system ATP-binding protein
MRQLIIELGITGHTVLLTSHVISDIEEVCSHVAILRNGSILEKGPIEEFLVHGKLEEGIARWYKGESTDEL